MAGGGCIGGGLVLLAIGLILAIVGGLYISPGLSHIERSAINKQIVVSSKDSATYDDWAGGYDNKTHYQMIFYMYNLTNLDAVRKGAKAVYTEHGPYIYRRHRTAINVSWDEGGDLLHYSNFRDYTFERELSVGPAEDTFLNINPVYLAALAQAQNELGMLTALSPAYIGQALDFLLGPFIPLYSIYMSPSYLQDARNRTLTDLIQNFNMTEDAAQLYFANAWANEIAPEYGSGWEGLLLSAVHNAETGITMESAQKMWDPNQQYSLLSEDAEVGWVWTYAQNDTAHALTLTEEFGITMDQLQTVIAWRTQIFAPMFQHPQYITEWGLGDITDLGWLQWFDGTPLSGTSTTVVWSELANPMGAVWEFFGSDDTTDNTFVSWQFSKEVMNRDTGLSNVYVFQEWILAETGGATNFSQWGLTSDQSDNLFAYSFQLGVGYGMPALTDLYGESGGLFRTKTVQQWVFDCEDYLLPILQPDALPCGVYTNHTFYPRTTIYTGKKNISRINEYKEWREMDTIKDLWAGDLKIEGHTALGQFQPDLKGTPNETIVVFDVNLVRSVPLKFNTTVEIMGITANRYLVDWQTLLAPNDFYYQNVMGLANLTGWQQGAPVFLGNWDMAGVENRTDFVEGLNTTSTEYEWNTVLDVEPQTGNTVQAYQKLSVNIYLPKDASSYFALSPFKNNPRVGIAYPLMKAGEYVILSEDLAKELKDKLKLVPTLKKVGFWICVTVGPAMALVGLAMATIGYRRRKKAQYEKIY